jgi:hypothetical protein
MNINTKYIEWYQEEVTQPEFWAADGNIIVYRGTGEDEGSLPLHVPESEGCLYHSPQKKVKIWKQRIKPEYQHLPLIDLLR